ncbi:unnamed protein product [Brachionus calyciflorus]|uniref:BED-type domain-containing protein n=1 Tax=Brachionus calyciflorus TaxID=104777 RepID=A0A813Z9Y7_9BILA|nr:unnamed protein product [Brachionus calyciflorus]
MLQKLMNYVWRYFEIYLEDDYKVKCNECNQIVDNKLSLMKTHLNREHSTLKLDKSPLAKLIKQENDLENLNKKVDIMSCKVKDLEQKYNRLKTYLDIQNQLVNFITKFEDLKFLINKGIELKNSKKKKRMNLSKNSMHKPKRLKTNDDLLPKTKGIKKIFLSRSQR